MLDRVSVVDGGELRMPQAAESSLSLPPPGKAPFGSGSRHKLLNLKNAHTKRTRPVCWECVCVCGLLDAVITSLEDFTFKKILNFGRESTASQVAHNGFTIPKRHDYKPRPCASLRPTINTPYYPYYPSVSRRSAKSACLGVTSGGDQYLGYVYPCFVVMLPELFQFYHRTRSEPSLES